MSNISFNCDDVSFEWNAPAVIAKWLEDIINHHQSSLTSLSFVYCSDERLLQINKEYLQHNYYTDVITFDLSDDASIEGEIYISLDRVKEQATEYKVSFEDELCRIMAHGLLHLLGFDDHTDEDIQEMRSKETMCLSLLPEVPRGTFS